MLMQKIASKKKVFSGEVCEVQNKLVKIDQSVRRILGDCEEVVEKMKTQKESYGECSSRLRSLDDQITILRSVMQRLDLNSVQDVEERVQSISISNQDNFLTEKIKRKAGDVGRESQVLLNEMEVLKKFLEGLLEGLPELDSLESCNQEQLAGTFMEASNMMVEREVVLARVWEAVASWEAINNQNAGKYCN